GLHGYNPERRNAEEMSVTRSPPDNPDAPDAPRCIYSWGTMHLARTYMQRYDVRLHPDTVAALKRLALNLSCERGTPVSWVDLLRHGMDLVLASEGQGLRRAVPPFRN